MPRPSYCNVGTNVHREPDTVVRIAPYIPECHFDGYAYSRDRLSNGYDYSRAVWMDRLRFDDTLRQHLS